MNSKIAILTFLILALVFSSSVLVFASQKPAQILPFNVYSDKNSNDNHFVPSGWMGDVGAVNMDLGCVEDYYSGSSSIRIDYNGELPQGAGWAGVYWQHPENNWGQIDGGFNLGSASRLTFWAKGKKGGEKLEFKVGGVTGLNPDSDITSIGPIALTTEWKQYEIDLADVDTSYISGGFVWAASRMDNPYGFIVFLDEIKYE